MSGVTNSHYGLHFEQSTEVRIIKKQLDEFIEREVKPLEEEHDQYLGEDGMFNRADEDGKMTPEFQEIRNTIRRKSAEAGFLSMAMPEELGGEGMGGLPFTQVLEHLHNRNPDGFHNMVMGGVGGPVAPQPDNLTKYQIEQWIEPSMAGELTNGMGLTEPDHGSDPTWMDSTAQKDGDEWVINGTKCFSTMAPIADFWVIHARTSGEDGDVRGISSFFVDRDNPGLEVGKYQRYMGDPLMQQAFVHLDDCCVPEENMIGSEGRGLLDQLKSFGSTRVEIGAEAVGRSQWMFDQCIKYAENRQTFGEPIGKNQFVQGMLADLRADIEQMRWHYRHAAWLADRRELSRWEESSIKLRGAELWNKAADVAIQIHGGAGVMNSLPFAAEYTHARRMRIVEGTDEIQKRNMARDLLNFD
ncbi:acyl-CoA dehydrogenase family protein [Haloferax sp. ATB1]|uniref:acyl-CoA dehydrogenase family protein n=1 Tax=Haloferax sp. ATB1 TaxID=1508454 RepID=UPI000694238C|nr:acyl-CoA dehydrogenase [Haloferax sp. ATB1]